MQVKIESILVPVDFSDTSEAAVDYALRLAKESGAKIHLLHSYPVSPGIATPYGPALPDAVFESIRSGAEQRLADTRKRLVAEGVEVTAHLTAEPASFAIAEAAEELGVDCVVMGTRGLSGLKHVLLGSVAERTVRTAPCPVFTVPLADAAA
jgi:nucleotide-binding universal stress UspA family protein